MLVAFVTGCLYRRKIYLWLLSKMAAAGNEEREDENPFNESKGDREGQWLCRVDNGQLTVKDVKPEAPKTGWER